jgi:hypothetical protein
MSEPKAAISPDSKPSEVAPDFDLIDHLAELLRTEINNQAATWEEDFDAGPGEVVSVRDAARVVARVVLDRVAIQQWGIDIGPNVFRANSRAHAEAHIAATGFGTVAHRTKAGPWHRLNRGAEWLTP